MLGNIHVLVIQVHVHCWHLHGSHFLIVCVYIHVCVHHVGWLQDGCLCIIIFMNLNFRVKVLVFKQ